jgi:hypothetical protein
MMLKDTFISPPYVQVVEEDVSDSSEEEEEDHGESRSSAAAKKEFGHQVSSEINGNDAS